MRYNFALGDGVLPCAVNQASKNALKALKLAGHEADIDLAPYDCLVINLPLVAWKKRLIYPIWLMIKAMLLGKSRLIMLHEWEDLHPLRKLAIRPLLWLSNDIIFSSPLVREGYSKKAYKIFPVPANIKKPDGINRKNRDRLVVGHFGSIYPSKNSLEMLEIAHELKEKGLDFELRFIGDFVKASDTLEADFYARIESLGLKNHVTITGYIASLHDLFTQFEEVSVFVYPFTEGLTSRRSSVLAVAQTGRPIITTKPQRKDEFDHHTEFKGIIASGVLHFRDDYANAIIELANMPSKPFEMDLQKAWGKVAEVIQTSA